MEFTTRLLVKRNISQPFSDVFVFSARQQIDHMERSPSMFPAVAMESRHVHVPPSVSGETLQPGGVSGSALQ